MESTRNAPVQESRVGKWTVMAYALLAYALFLPVFIYFILFSIPLFVPHSVDHSLVAPMLGTEGLHGWLAAGINIALLALFGLQHSLMARAPFKRWLAKFLPRAAERATYVLMSTLALGLLLFGWQPLPGTVWNVEGGLAWLLYGINAGAWGFAFAATYMIDHFDLFGLKQAWHNLRDREPDEPRFMTHAAYGLMRHPLQSGIFFGLWVVPEMSVSHLLFSLGLSAYIFVGTSFEERDLVRLFGERYRRYRVHVPMLLPRLRGPFRERREVRE